MSDEMNGFAVKRAFDGISIINHQLDGSTFEACYYAGDIPELIALLQVAHQEWLDEQAADYAAECESLNAAEDRWISDRETALEIEFSKKGHDDIPF